MKSKRLNCLELEEKLERAKVVDVMTGIANSGRPCVLRVSKRGGFNLTVGTLKCKGKTIPALLKNLHKKIGEINNEN